MPVPVEMMELLQSMEIVGVPAVVGPGEPIQPQLNPPPAALDALAIKRTLAQVDLRLLLNPITNPKDEVVRGDIDLAGVSKAVTFPAFTTQPPPPAPSIDPNEIPAGALSHLEPQAATGLPPYTLAISAGVQGLVTKLRTQIDGIITGSIFRQILPAVPNVALTWHVTDSQGNGVPDVVDIVGNPAAPSYVFLPTLVEFTWSPGSRTRRLRCDLRITTSTGPGGAPETTNFSVGPYNVDVPDVPIPTVMAMTEDADYGGKVLFSVPAGSAVSAADQIAGLLQPALTVFNRLAAVLGGIATNISYATAAVGLGDLMSLLPASTFVRGNQDDLDNVVRRKKTLRDQRWEDCIDSLFLVGPPGRGVTVSVRKHQWEGTGKFRLTLGGTCFAKIAKTSVYPLVVAPGDAVAQSIVAPEDGNYHDNISSFAFV
jgi:hypothetical protein